MTPRCRGRACEFQWSLGLCGWATHAWQVQSAIPDQEGHGGLRRGRRVQVHFRDVYVQHQAWLCKRTSDGVTPKKDPASLKKAKLESAQWEGPDTGPTVCRGCGNYLNEIPCTWDQGQQRERAGFLVSRSLTLLAAPLWARGVNCIFSLLAHKKGLNHDWES